GECAQRFGCVNSEHAQPVKVIPREGRNRGVCREETEAVHRGLPNTEVRVDCEGQQAVRVAPLLQWHSPILADKRVWVVQQHGTEPATVRLRVLLPLGHPQNFTQYLGRRVRVRQQTEHLRPGWWSLLLFGAPSVWLLLWWGQLVSGIRQKIPHRIK